MDHPKPPDHAEQRFRERSFAYTVYHPEPLHERIAREQKLTAEHWAVLVGRRPWWRRLLHRLRGKGR